MDKEMYKKQAGERAVADYVRSGMVLGLGTGSTAVWAVRRIGALIEAGELENIVGIPTSGRTERAAQEVGIPLTTLDAHPEVDVTIDGADEIDPNLNLIKGGGGALLREKIVAQASRQVIIVGDDSKLVERLGTTFELPLEVIPFGAICVERFITGMGAKATLRETDGLPYLTDNGNQIIDVAFEGGIDDVKKLAARLCGRAGLLEHGLFLGLATEVIVAGEGGIEIIKNT